MRISPTLLVQAVEDGDGAHGFVVILDEGTGEEVAVPLVLAHRVADAIHHSALELQGIQIHKAARRQQTHE